MGTELYTYDEQGMEDYSMQRELGDSQADKKIESYVLKFDRDKYEEADKLRFTDPKKYYETLDALNAYTRFQLQTNLGERLNVLQSTYRFDIKDDHLWGENTTEPFINIVQRGRDTRRIEGRPQDYVREDAEVKGFTIIDDTLSSPDTPIGTTILNISLPGEEGSTYQHNFYDIFTLKEDVGKRYVETKRFSSALSAEEYKPFVDRFTPNHSKPLGIPHDEFYLAHPLILHTTKEEFAEELHKTLHKDHGYFDTADFQLVVDSCNPYVDKYLESLISDPRNIDRQNLCYNAILNVADKTASHIKKSRQEKKAPLIALQEVTDDDILYYGTQEVRSLEVGCGFSGGADVSMFGSSIAGGVYSVSDFGGHSTEAKWSYHKGDCVVCKKKALDVGPCKICKSCEAKFN